MIKWVKTYSFLIIIIYFMLIFYSFYFSHFYWEFSLPSYCRIQCVHNILYYYACYMWLLIEFLLYWLLWNNLQNWFLSNNILTTWYHSNSKLLQNLFIYFSNCYTVAPGRQVREVFFSFFVTFINYF